MGTIMSLVENLYLVLSKNIYELYKYIECALYISKTIILHKIE